MNFLEWLKIIFLGIIEGITEWLPISSTGHMILVEQFIQLNDTDAFKEMFFVVIQLGAIMAVVFLYFEKLNPFSRKKTKDEKLATMNIWYKVIIGVLPAAVIGLLFDDWLNDHLYNSTTVAIMLVVYGILFIVVENYNKKKGNSQSIETFEQLSYRTAFLIGVFQVLALIPGTSRSGATILGAILLGTSRFIATEFSFFLSIPVMIGASFLKLVKYFLDGHTFTQFQVVSLLLGMSVAFLVSLLAIQYLLKYLKRHDFKAFGWYRIGLGIIVITYFFFFK